MRYTKCCVCTVCCVKFREDQIFVDCVGFLIHENFLILEYQLVSKTFNILNTKLNLSSIPIVFTKQYYDHEILKITSCIHNI